MSGNRGTTKVYANISNQYYVKRILERQWMEELETSKTGYFGFSEVIMCDQAIKLLLKSSGYNLR